MDEQYGNIRSVYVTRTGSDVISAVSAGATAIPLEDCYDFEEDGGQCVLWTSGSPTDYVINYTGYDDEYDLLLLDPTVLDEDGVPIASPLPINLTVEDSVYVYPLSIEKRAYVDLKNDDEDEAVDVRVPHNLVDLIAEGIRSEDSGYESVGIIEDSSDWVISEVIGEPAVINDLAAPLPVEVLTDGIAPPPVTSVTAVSGIGSIFLNWVPVVNPDVVTYDVHAVPVKYLEGLNDFTPDYTNLVGSTKSTQFVLKSLSPNASAVPNAPIEYTETVRVNIIAVAISEGVVTLYVDTASSFMPGDEIRVSGFGEPYDTPSGQTVTVSSASPGILTYQVDSPLTASYVPGTGTVEGEQLQYYSIKIVSKDADGTAAPSPYERGRAIKATGIDLAADSVTAIQLAAESVRAEHLIGDLVLGTRITTALDGARAEMDTDGFHSFDAMNRPVLDVPTTPNELGEIIATLNAHIQARSLTIYNQLSLRGGNNEFAKGSVTTLQSGTTAPQSPPTPVIDWETKEIPNWIEQNYGFHWDGGKWWSSGVFYGGSLNQYTEGTNSFVSVYRASGTFELPNQVYPWGGVAVIGSDAYALGQDANEEFGYSARWYVYRFNATTGEYITRYEYRPSGTTNGPYSKNKPSLGVRGTNLMICQADQSGTYRVYQMTPNTASAGIGMSPIATLKSMSANDDVTGILWGTFDFGASRYVVTRRNTVTALVFDSTGTRITNEEFPLPAKMSGIGWNGSNFYTRTQTAVYKHTNIHWTTESATRWVSHAWYDSNPNSSVPGDSTHETLISDPISYTMKKRARLTVTTPQLPAPDTVSPVDSVTGVRIYHGIGSSKPLPSQMRREAADLPNGVITAVYTTPFEGIGGVANLGSPFPATSPATITTSAASDNFVLNGDGSGQWPKLINPEINGTLGAKTYYEKYPDGRLICRGVHAFFSASAVSYGWTFPIPFVGELPHITVTPSSTVPHNIDVGIVNESLTFVNIRYIRTTDTGTNVFFKAEGRWK